MADTDLSRVEGWLDAYMQRLAPAARRKIAMKIGQALRRSNAKRIGQNVEPDGTAMAPRRPRIGRDGSPVRGKAKMFRKIRHAKNLRIKARPDSVEVTFGGGAVGKIAATHHDGDVGFVGRTRDGRTIRTRYEARRLLGFGGDDTDMVLDTVIAALENE